MLRLENVWDRKTPGRGVALGRLGCFNIQNQEILESGLQVDRVTEQGGGQFNGVLDIVVIDHFARAVNVAAGD